MCVRSESKYPVSNIYPRLNLVIKRLNLFTVFRLRHGTVFLDIYPRRTTVFKPVLVHLYVLRIFFAYY